MSLDAWMLDWRNDMMQIIGEFIQNSRKYTLGRATNVTFLRSPEKKTLEQTICVPLLFYFVFQTFVIVSTSYKVCSKHKVSEDICFSECLAQNSEMNQLHFGRPLVRKIVQLHTVWNTAHTVAFLKNHFWSSTSMFGASPWSGTIAVYLLTATLCEKFTGVMYTYTYAYAYVYIFKHVYVHTYI